MNQKRKDQLLNGITTDVAKYLQRLDKTHHNTCVHSICTAYYALWIFENLNLDVAESIIIQGALLHDIGKPLVTTPEGKAPGHNESGVKVFNQYFSHFFTNKKMKKYIRTMIYYHMHLMNMVRDQSKDYSYYKLLKGIEGIFPLNDLVCMSKCDKLGRLANRPETISTLDTYVEEKVSRCGNHALKPFVDGKLLIELGFKPNQDFKELLDWAYDLQMRGHDKESVIQLLKGRKDGK